MRRSSTTFDLVPIADTTDRFLDFAPYVASVNDAGTVAFQATLRGGETGIFTGSGGDVVAVAESTTSVVRRFCSHPDLDNEGSSCVYGEFASGGAGLVVFEGGRGIAVADTRDRFLRIGPLGPTMHDGRRVAFRADLKEGGSGVFVLRGGSIELITDTTRFAGFQGLPVVNGGGAVVFRADLSNGGQGIYMSRGDEVETVIESGRGFRDLGYFPCVNGQGAVVFGATLEGGGSGIFRASGGQVTPVVDTRSGFESFRGALINDADVVYFYATPPGGQLGIYTLTDSGPQAVVSIGDPLFDSSIVELALNPVSINNEGQLAIRIRLGSGRQVIVRADPGSRRGRNREG